MQGELDDLFNDAEPTPEVQEAVIPAPAPEEKGDKTQAEVLPEPATEAPPAPEPVKETVPLAALLAEREKRKELERQVSESRQPAATKQDFYEDPEGYIQSLRRQDRLEMSAALVESQHSDFREQLAIFVEEANKYPVLAAQLEAHPHPALFAYQQAKRIQEFRQMQDMPAFLAKKEAEIEARIRAEYEQKAAAKKSLADALPPDLSGVRGAKTANEPFVDESLESLFQRK